MRKVYLTMEELKESKYAPSFKEVTLPEKTGKSSGFFMIGLRTFYDRYEWPSCMGDTHSAHHKKMGDTHPCNPSV